MVTKDYSNKTDSTEKNINLLIYQKYVEFIYYVNDITRKYPKSEHFTLVSEIKNSLYSGLRDIMFAIKAFSKDKKLEFLNYLDIELSLLKIHFRLSYKYKYISLQNYQTVSSHLTDICNMLGGWISSCRKR